MHDDSTHAPGRYGSAAEHYRRGEHAQARADLAEMMRESTLLGKLSRFYYAMSSRLLGLQDLQAGRFEQAERRLRSAMELVGREAELTSYLASIYARGGRAEPCAIEAEKLVRAHPDRPDTWRKLAQAQWQSGRREEAYLTLCQAMRRVGEAACLLLQEGLFLAAEGKHRQARRFFERASETDSANADGHYFLALAAAAEGDVQAAARSFQRAFELRPSDCLCAYQLAIAARAAAESGFHIVLRLPEGSPRAASTEMRQLAQYVAREPDFAEAFLSLPPSDLDEELFHTLVGVLQVAIALHPRHADLHCCCAKALHRLGRASAALEHVAAALEINPGYVQAHILLGRLHAEAGRTEEALEHVRRAIAAGADWPDIHCFAADLLERCRRKQAAREHLERALELNANYAQAAERLRRLAA